MKELKLFAFALIAVLACVGAASCSKDDGDVTPPGLEETGMLLTGVGDYRFYYDDKGRCIEVDCYDHITIDWDKSEIVIDEGGNNPMMDIKPIKFKTNGKGYITEFSQTIDYLREGGLSHKESYKTNLTYDKEGHLTKATFKTYDISGGKEEKDENLTERGDYTLTWDKGNLVNAKYIGGYIDDNESEKEEYNYKISYNSNSENVYKQWTMGCFEVFYHDIFVLCHVGLFGVGTANFPTNIHEYGDYEDDYSVRVSTYSSGLISSEKFDGETYDYTYDEVGTRSNSLDSSLPTKAKKRPLRHHRKMWK